MKYSKLNEKIEILSRKSQKLTTPAEKTEALISALDVAGGVISILSGADNIEVDSEEALENIVSANNFQNSKVQQWFSFHPYYPDERLALNFYENEIVQARFYWLNDNSTKARISGGVMISPNWEDTELTRNDSYKVGIDFFLKKDASAVVMVVSNNGNLRVMEFSDKLTHTQVEILNKISGSFELDSKQALHSILWESMALSEVNKKFYEGIAKYFAILQSHLMKCGKSKNDSKMFSSRLMGRLLFIWFLRKKGVINNEKLYFPENIKNSTVYYNKVLKKLFFETLNTPIFDRKTEDLKTPYLNGGLFDAHDNDWRFEELSFPDNFFNNLFEHLDKYNFTTDESSPDYEQVAIDPEMLGRVFESLLAEQTTDTGEQARKAKGAFYTPREVVAYMCAESLRQYLYVQFPDEKYHDGIDKLIDTPDYAWETAHTNAKQDLWPFENTTKFIPQVIGALDSLTVLDPACGSGAFPMGMLQLLTRIYERLDSRFDPYETKLRVIQESIFGVDIEPMAVEIARLRAWLAIIVDDDGEVDPLPNLDFKFVCADSLVPLDRAQGLFSDHLLQEKMASIRNKFFNARKPETKEKYKSEYYKLTTPVGLMQDKRECQLKSFDPFKNQRPAEFFDGEYMFGVERFDVVIGNPPYVHLEKMKDIAKTKYVPLNFRTYEPRGDLYCLFIENSISLLKENGVLSFITSNKWMRAGYGKSLRGFLSEKTSPIYVIDLGGGVFDSATVDTDIIITRKSRYTDPTKAVSMESGVDTSNLRDSIRNSCRESFFQTCDNWIISNSIEDSIRSKIERLGVPLRSWDIKISYGIKTGCNEAFVIDEQRRKEILDSCDGEERARTDEIIRPILRGRDIKKDKIQFNSLYVIYAYNGSYKILKDEYPVIYNHLLGFKDKLQNRGQCRYTSTGKAANGGDYPGQHHWLELDNNPRLEYLDDFSKPKIIYPCIMANGPRFFYDKCGHYCTVAPGNIITGDNLSFLSKMLQTKIAYFALRRFYMGGGIEGELKTNRLLLLPLPNPRKYANFSVSMKDSDEAMTEMLLGQMLGLTPEELDYIDSFVF